MVYAYAGFQEGFSMSDIKTAGPKSVADYEHQAWQAVAQLYQENAAFITAFSGQSEMILEVAGVNEQSTLLDVGCGPGLLTAQLADFVRKVVGIDFSSNMIAEAKSLFPQFEFREADAEKIPFKDHTFGCAVVNYCAHHLARPKKGLREIHRVLKRGGRIVIVHPIQSRQASWGSFLQALLQELPPEANPSGPLYNVEDPRDYITLLESSGFQNVRCEIRVKPVRLENIDRLLTAAWAIASLADQPEDVQARIRAGTIENASKFLELDGSYVFPDEVLLAWAER
jgi:ubiquinone/menaquinone biosynthesis C-methylase UbiE